MLYYILNNAALYPSLIYIFHFAKEKTTFIHFFYLCTILLKSPKGRVRAT